LRGDGHQQRVTGEVKVDRALMVVRASFMAREFLARTTDIVASTPGRGLATEQPLRRA
jgi:hypothetical protein